MHVFRSLRLDAVTVYFVVRHFGANGDTHMPAERAGMFRDLGDEQIWIHAFGQRAASAAAIEFARDFEVNGRKIVEAVWTWA